MGGPLPKKQYHIVTLLRYVARTPNTLTTPLVTQWNENIFKKRTLLLMCQNPPYYNKSLPA